MKATSLRRTTLLWMTVLLAIVGLATTVIAYRLAYFEAADFLDGQLRQIALNAGPTIQATNQPSSPDQDPEDQFAIDIRDATGRLLHASLPGIRIPLQPASGYTNVRVDGELWRVYTTRGDARIVQVAQRDTVRAEIASGTALGAAAPIIIVIPLSWLVVGWAMNRMFGRLQTLADDLARRSITATAPLPLQGLPAEVAPLVESANGLIERLQAAIAAQQRFVADAAHELRTPLAAMQIQVDALASSSASARDDVRTALAGGVGRASALVNQLLRLARLEEPTPAATETIDMMTLLLERVADHAVIAAAKNIELGVSAGTPATIEAPADEVRQLLDVLIENAIRYTKAGGTVDVSLDRHAGSAVVEVLDSGVGLADGTEARIFDRFYRAAPAGIEGTGLGLAIARRVADRNGFGLSVENRTDGVPGVLARFSVPLRQLREEPGG